VSRFDIVAFVPTNEKEFHSCCEEGLCDIIQLPVPLTFNLKKKDISSAITRDITFEICYAPSLKGIDEALALFFSLAYQFYLFRYFNFLRKYLYIH
jgi:hypothetical protein